MAFALSVKSKMDFPRVGGIFIVLTLIITIFTLFYASLLLEPTLHFCQIIIYENQNENLDKIPEENVNNLGFFNGIKRRISKFNDENVMQIIQRNKSTEKFKAILLEDFKPSHSSK